MLRSKKPVKFENDPEVHEETQNSISWAEGSLGKELRGPNLHKDSWWYIDQDKKKELEGANDPRELPDRGPVYHYTEAYDKDTDETLNSARYAEDFFGSRHPNRFTGEFDDMGNHIAKSNAGKGQYQNQTSGAIEVVKYDEKGFPLDRNGKPIKYKGEYDPNDPTGLHGYFGSPFDPDHPDYQEDMSKNLNNKYYGNYTGSTRPKDWWNNLSKQKVGDEGMT